MCTHMAKCHSKFSVSYRHKIVSAEEAKAKHTDRTVRGGGVCAERNENALDYFDTSCHFPVCSQCIHCVTHSGHTFQLLSDPVSVIQQRIVSIVERVNAVSLSLREAEDDVARVCVMNSTQ